MFFIQKVKGLLLKVASLIAPGGAQAMRLNTTANEERAAMGDEAEAAAGGDVAKCQPPVGACSKMYTIVAVIEL